MQTIPRDEAHTGAGVGGTTRPTGRVSTGHALSALAVLFLLFDSLGKLFQVEAVVAGSTALGYPAGTVFPLGVVLLLCVVVYVLPATSVLGAVLLTGYLGGAIATHVRVGNPLFSHVLFPVYVALVLWGGLYLREDRLRALLPWRRDR
jgi:hypothetical protein